MSGNPENIIPKVLVTGGTGIVGRKLVKLLTEKGYNVSLLSRKHNRPSHVKTFFWDPAAGEIENGAIESADYIIHLAGANIGSQRWTRKRRQVIIDSRVKTAELIFRKARENSKLRAFISASATGYYGSVTSENIYTENDNPCNDFTGEVCRLWEEAAGKFEASGIRTVIIRTGIVLSGEGGAMRKMTGPSRAGIGSVLGDGNQYMPWIHVDDLCNIYIKAIEDKKMSGAYNAVAPAHITNREFSSLIARLTNRLYWLQGVPSWLLKLVFGEMSAILLSGSRISAEKIKAAGYIFKYPDPAKAIENMLLKEGK